jgi:ferric-dicitrate binding protein FerR (iron transport regulator)
MIIIAKCSVAGTLAIGAGLVFWIGCAHPAAQVPLRHSVEMSAFDVEAASSVSAAESSGGAIKVRNGRLVFAGATLAQAVDAFNARNHCQVVIADPKIAQTRIGGSFSVHDPERFAMALTKVAGIRAVREGDVIQLFR